MTPEGTTWNVDAITKIIDGDSLRIRRTRTVTIDGRTYRATDANPDGTPGDVLIRLAWVDTPEKGDPRWSEAKWDLGQWLATRVLPGGDGQLWPRISLRIVCFESAGWDRLLGDLLDANGNSASQWLMRDRGWPAYQGGKA